MTDIDHYMQKIRDAFFHFDDEANRFMEEFKSSLEEYDQNRGLSYEEFVNHFGIPEDVVSEYYENDFSVSVIQLMKKNRSATMIRRYVYLCLLLLLLGWGIYWLSSFISSNNTSKIHSKSELIIMEND